MSEAAKQWEGQIVEGTFPLRQYLGGTDHSAVFLTEFGDGVPQKAAIKLYPADAATADLQLSSWESAAQLSHPSLLRLLRSGRCRIDGNDLLYLVMEYAEEDLSQILPQRALSTEETRDMLGPVLDALQYLHGKGFVHGDLKPANILASGDHLKLSSDAISRIGKALSGLRRAGVYDPPEAISGTGTPAGDVWSLGTALVEVLTQKLPEWQPGPHREPVVPANIPSPFQEIARECLRLEPDRRISIAEIGLRLNPRSVAATASASSAAPVASLGASPAAVAPKMPPVTPKVVTASPMSPRSVAKIQSSPHRPPPYRESGGRPRFLVPLILVALLVAAIVTVPRLLTHRPEVQPAATASSGKPSSQPAAQKPAQSAAFSKPKATSETEPKVSETTRSAAPSVAQANQKPAQPTAPESLKVTSEKVQPPDRPAPAASSVAADSVRPASGGMGSSKGEVLDQVLPDVSGKARATIHGKVRVSVRVHVDPSGGVSEAEFDSLGPSKFFADLAMQAARKWAFTPPEVNGKSVASEWRIRFEFTPKDTKVIPTQTAP